jgi:hypothetical protein
VRFAEIMFLMIRSKKSTEKWIAIKMKSGGSIKHRSYKTAQEAKRHQNYTCKSLISISGNHVKKNNTTMWYLHFNSF